MKRHECAAGPVQRPWYFLFLLMVMVATFLLLPRTTPAQPVTGAIPLESLLQPDGTLNLVNGARGSVNPAGFSMATRTDGTPVFTPLNGVIPGNENWQTVFGLPGANNEVKAVVMDGSGSVYIGGTFTSVSGVAANRVAKWNGTAWSALGSGMDGEVWSLALDGSTLYAGGAFLNAGGTLVNGVAKWDGGTWSGLGSGMSRAGTPYVIALAVDDSGNLFAAGWFSGAGGTPANNIAKWNGSSWSSLGTSPNDGVDSIAYSLYWDGAVLYVGGNFTHAGTVAVGYIAAWTGSAWQALGGGTSPGMEYPGGVYALTKDSSGVLYAGGGFTGVGSVGAYIPVSYVAKFTGGAWSAVGTGINGDVYSLGVDGSDNLYAGGGFSSPEGLILRWDGASWTGLGTGYSGVKSFVLSGTGGIFAGGTFDSAGGNPASKIAYWNGSSWSAMASGGMNATVNALALDGTGNLYAGGQFSIAGAAYANRIAMWDGTAWTALGTGMADGQVHALACDSSGNLYAGGTFSSVGGVTGEYIAKWDGSSWAPMAAIPSWVYALHVTSNDTIYAGTYSGGAGNVFRWTGTSWAALPGIESDDVLVLTSDSTGKLYAGGRFTNRVAWWDGVSSWFTLGGGIADGEVNALIVDSKGNLYAGGSFTTAEGSPADYLAKWDGAAWSALAGGPNGPVKTLGVDTADHLYAAGAFTVPGSNIAKWDGSAWTELGDGTNNQVNALAINNTSGDLYAGGMFTMAGMKDSRYIGWMTGLPTKMATKFPWTMFLPAIIRGKGAGP